MKLKRCKHASFIIFILVHIIGVRGLNFGYFDFKLSLQQHPFNCPVYKHLFYKLQKLTVEKSVFIDCVEITCIFFLSYNLQVSGGMEKESNKGEFHLINPSNKRLSTVC